MRKSLFYFGVIFLILVSLYILREPISRQPILDKLVFKIQPISYLSFDELVLLSQTKKPVGDLKEKLEKQLNTPYVVKSLWKTKELKKSYIRIAHWNIERGKNITDIKSIFLKPYKFYATNKANLKQKKHNNWKSWNELFPDSTYCVKQHCYFLPYLFKHWNCQRCC